MFESISKTKRMQIYECRNWKYTCIRWKSWGWLQSNINTLGMYDGISYGLDETIEQRPNIPPCRW